VGLFYRAATAKRSLIENAFGFDYHWHVFTLPTSSHKSPIMPKAFPALCLTLLIATTVAAADKTGKWAETPDPKLPNVLILGDSISIGYTLQVRELLDGKANVFRPHTADGTKPENCSGTTKGVVSVDRWLGDRKWDVIHFNWGLHDLKHVTEPGGNTVSKKPSDPVQATVDQYAANLEKIVERLNQAGAKLIFATTTPVVPNTTGPLRKPTSPPKYNAAALKIMKEHNVAVNDLFAFCQPQVEKLQRPKNVHFTAAGSQALAEQVAAAIQSALDSGSSQ